MEYHFLRKIFEWVSFTLLNRVSCIIVSRDMYEMLKKRKFGWSRSRRGKNQQVVGLEPL